MKVQTFLKEARDLYYDGKVTILPGNNYPSKLDLRLLETSLNSIAKDLINISTKTSEASVEALEHYTNLIEILEKKIEYISDMSDVFNYVNSYFDRRTVKDFITFNLKNLNTDSLYDDYQKGLTLQNVKYLYQCSKTLEGNSITFYNTNNSSHTGLYITSSFLDVLNINQITIRKSDGTVVEVDINSNESDVTYIKHDLLVSSQIIITFSLKASPDTVLTTDILNSINLSLVDRNYKTEGISPLVRSTIDSAELFSFIVSASLPVNTYLNIETNLELLDINGNIIDLINITLPVNNSEVCKRLDRINWNEVDTVQSLITNNKRSRMKKLTRSYLEGLEFKNERYITYIPKNTEENILNKYIRKLGNTSFKVNDKIVKKIVLNPCIEMYSFNTNESPTVKYITGVTKNETI